MRPDVRRPVLRGSQRVRGLWFDRTLLGEDEARRRLLAAWETGALAYQAGAGYLIEWKTAHRLQCEAAPGLPLCDDAGVLASAPLQPQERADIARGAAVLVFGAGLHVHALDAGSRIDPSGWLDVAAIPVCTPLTMPPGPQTGFSTSVAPPEHDLRTLLGDAVPPPSPRRAVFLDKAARRRGGDASAPWAKASAAAGVLGNLLLLPLALLAHLGAATASNGGKHRGRADAAPRSEWLAARMGKLASLTRIGRLLGWRQANYLRKMLRQFDEGNLDDALRHAIPLDSPHAPGRQKLGLWGRRANLDIGAGASAASIGLDPESLDLLRATYQRSFDALDRAGRIDEAVFVLAELMNRRQEAVDYLERKGRIVQAARLAETLELTPAVIVRLHCMAGNIERAVLLARLNGGFADAVAELERRRHDGAAGLRLEWAQDLAARGNLAEAASAIWPLKNERKRALDWLHQAEQGGGTLGVQGLLYAVALDRTSLRTHAAALHDLLSAPGPDAARQRIRACDCLLRLDGHNDATRRIAAALWRALVADRATGSTALPQERLARLLKLAADPVLSADAPRQALKDARAPTPLSARKEPLHIAFAEHGLHPLEDVRVLPDGGHLLALGEGGVVLAKEGTRAPMRFPVPAHHLVLSHNGRRALALARRERSVRVSRIDLVSGKVDDWFSADLRFWAGEFDGATWSVVTDERLLVLDATAPGQSALWQVADLPGKVAGFARHDDHEALLLAHGDATVEQWRYALPARRLLGRVRIAVPKGVCAVLPDCLDEVPLMLEVSAPLRDGDAPRLRMHDPDGADVLAAWPHTQVPQATLHGRLLLLRFDGDDGWHCKIMDADGRTLADIVLPGAIAPQATIQGGHMLAWDRRGRVVDIEIHTTAVRTLTFG